LKYVDLDGEEITVAANVRSIFKDLYMHSSTFRKEFTRAKNNSNVKNIMFVGSKAKSGTDGGAVDRSLTRKGVPSQSSDGKPPNAEYAVSGGPVVIGFGKGPEVAKLNAAHEVAEVNAAAVVSVGETRTPHEVAKDKAHLVAKELTDTADDVDEDAAEKALEGTEPDRKEKEKKEQAPAAPSPK
jgi:hypothetical protein